MIAIIKHKPLMGQRARDGKSSAFVTGRAVMFYRHRLQSSNRFSATVPNRCFAAYAFGFVEVELDLVNYCWSVRVFSWFWNQARSGLEGKHIIVTGRQISS
jgi:hypothetical protein